MARFGDDPADDGTEPPAAGPGSEPEGGYTERVGNDRDLWEGEATTPRAFKLIQGYVWHPRDQAVDLAAYLPEALGPDVHVLFDAMPAAPFTFFDDGTLSATQVVYQLTVVAIVQPGQVPDALLAEMAERLGERLETTPQGVGWQLMSDLREVD
ncbi:MAG: DUF3208 family protein [Trueperaceae bacterium]|nr:DUF3208 family protein [Trueperaceae bacterium]MCO5173263.1 DUF3208 domain-containing protein [Trueperaceae bacterium]MCW5818712.1 DUF3208 family protein [Trueperaceae bacterium]